MTVPLDQLIKDTEAERKERILRENVASMVTMAVLFGAMIDSNTEKQSNKVID